MVADAVRETPDTTTLVLFTGNDKLEYAPGHFCTVDPHQFDALERWTAYLEDLKGRREAPRAYSLSSSPHERYIAITVKEERYQPGATKYPPLLSPLLVRGLHAGRRMVVTGFTGPYTPPEDLESRTDHLVHLVAGSGSVPNFSILKQSLHLGQRLRHTFIYSNKTHADICFRAELEALERKHSDKLRVVHLLTRETDDSVFGPQVRKGRVTLELLRELIPAPDTCLVYACGPGIGPHERQAAKEKGVEPQPRFLETALRLLSELGVPSQRIRRESYG
ncbi:MAG: oxidoreductase [Myxococcales bacterium]|nr:oxidoreductase [Myxococcales bacterium]